MTFFRSEVSPGSAGEAGRTFSEERSLNPGKSFVTHSGGKEITDSFEAVFPGYECI